MFNESEFEKKWAELKSIAGESGYPNLLLVFNGYNSLRISVWESLLVFRLNLATRELIGLEVGVAYQRLNVESRSLS